MEILLENVGQDPMEIDVDSWDLKRYRDAHRASELTLKCSRRTPITKYAKVIAREDGKVYFRGYIQKPKIKNINTRELACKGEEDLLSHRFTGRYSFVPSERKLYHAFQSDAPTQTADTYGVTENVGLLFMANSMIPYHGNVFLAEAYSRDPTATDDLAHNFEAIGTSPHVAGYFNYFWNRTTQVMWGCTSHTNNAATWIEIENPSKFNWLAHGDGWIYSLPGLGTSSRIGSVDIYAEGTLLPRVGTYALMHDPANPYIACHGSADDLFVRLDDDDYNQGFGPRYMMLAENAYDTGVRLGTLDNPDTIISGNVQLNFDKIMDLLIDIAEFYGLHVRYRYESDYTYMDVLEAPVENEFILPEEHIADISQSMNTDLKAYALIGKGIGSRDVQAIYTPSDHSWMGTWYEETYDVENGFLDTHGNLKSMTDAEYARLQSDEIFTVSPSESWPHRPVENDMVRLKLLGEADRLMQIESIKYDSVGKLEFDLGNRRKEILDAFQAKSSLSKVFTQEYKIQFGKDVKVWNWNGSAWVESLNTGNLLLGDITHGWCKVGSAGRFTLPANLYQSDGSHRVTLDYSFRCDELPTPVYFWAQINGFENIFSQPRHMLLGDSVSDLDITALCTFGGYTYVDFWLKKVGEVTGVTDCEDHPTAYFTITIKAWKRTLL